MASREIFTGLMADSSVRPGWVRLDADDRWHLTIETWRTLERNGAMAALGD